jgi:AcrR family transcriptional regulator
VARDLIAANGFHGTSMSKIAKRAGISPATIYHHFASKDELIHQLYSAIKRQALQEALARHDEHAPLREQQFNINRSYIRYLLDHPQDASFLAQYERSPYSRAEISIEEQDLQMAVCERAIREHIVKDVPCTLLAVFSTGVAGVIAEMQDSPELEMTDELMERVLDMCWDAIRR